MNMYKLVMFVALTIILTCTVAVLALAQTDPDPPGIIDLLTTFAVSLTALASAVVGVSELIFGRWLKWDGVPAKVGTFALAVVLSFVGWKFDLGMYAMLEVWWHVALVGVMGTLLSYGIFSVEIVRLVLEAFGIRVPAQKK